MRSLSAKSAKKFYRLASITLMATGISVFATAVNAQSGSPVPGGWTPLPPSEPASSAPMPGSERIDASGGAHFSSGTPAPASKYAQLPLSLFDAKARMQELNTMASVAKAQDILDSVNRLSEWLGDMCDAHNRMAASFAKHDQTKNQALAEKQAVQKFAQVRNQAQLLKAQLLINQHRFPEALTPLVDIVIAEPLSPTGASAYHKLKELGFSEDLSFASDVAAASTANAVTAEPVKHAPLQAVTKGAPTAASAGLKKIR